ncbi:hypothetical protein AB1Y20_000918 [Prymnesium parvum]|uniref:Uncharacterized protein n=1 Tax=Prymnesium parvum TaxID=97485 RepID=A0AB34K9J6_PRYPA
MQRFHGGAMSALPRRALVAGLYAAVATGSFYAFGLYSDALQEQFDLSPADLTNINTIPSASLESSAPPSPRRAAASATASPWLPAGCSSPACSCSCTASRTNSSSSPTPADARRIPGRHLLRL